MLNRNLIIGSIILTVLFIIYIVSLHESKVIYSLQNIPQATSGDETTLTLRSTQKSLDGCQTALALIRRCIIEHPFQVFRQLNLTKFAHPSDGDVHVSKSVLTSHGDPSKVFEHPLTVQMLKLLSEAHDPLVLDIGANIRVHTTFIANAGYRVHAFEPFKKNHPILECDVVVNGFNKSNVKINTFGLSRKNEDICMSPQTGNVGGTHVNAQKTDCEPLNMASFQRLDDYLETWLKGEVPYLIKIDTEGYEFHALEPAKQYFKKYGSPKHIFTEYYPPFLTRAGVENPVDYLNFLRELGLTITHNGNVVSIYC